VRSKELEKRVAAAKAKEAAKIDKRDAVLARKAQAIAEEANAAIEAKENALASLREQLEPQILSTVIDAVASGLTLKETCAELGIKPERVRALASRDEEFRSAYFAAREAGKQLKIDALQDIMIERAAEKSDLLMIFALKALDPSVYNDRLVIQGSGKHGEMLFGTIADLVREERLNSSTTVELIEGKTESPEEASAERVRGDQRELSGVSSEDANEGREDSREQDLQREVPGESEGASGGSTDEEQGSQEVPDEVSD